MRFKLDENLGERGAQLLRNAGHDTFTVPEQKLHGACDRDLISVCHSEKRCLVTLDLDFANPLSFTPSLYCGIAVLRLPPRSTPEDIITGITTLRDGVRSRDISGKLWIIQKDRIREYQEDIDD